MRKPFSQSIRNQVQAKSSICYLCEGEIDFDREWHIDHIICKSKGGPDDLWNLSPTHPKCNVFKGTKDALYARSKIRKMTESQKKQYRKQPPKRFPPVKFPLVKSWIPKEEQK